MIVSLPMISVFVIDFRMHKIWKLEFPTQNQILKFKSVHSNSKPESLLYTHSYAVVSLLSCSRWNFIALQRSQLRYWFFIQNFLESNENRFETIRILSNAKFRSPNVSKNEFQHLHCSFWYKQVYCYLMWKIILTRITWYFKVVLTVLLLVIIHIESQNSFTLVSRTLIVTSLPKTKISISIVKMSSYKLNLSH